MFTMLYNKQKIYTAQLKTYGPSHPVGPLQNSEYGEKNENK